MKAKKGFYLLLLVVFAVSLNSSTFAGDKVALRLKLEEGQVYKMKVVQDFKISQTIQGQTQQMPQKTEMKYTYAVEDTEDNGDIVLRVTYDAMIFEQQGPMGVTKYDSSNPSASQGPQAAVFNAIVGKSFTMIITEDGHVKEVKGVDELIKDIMDKMEGIPEGPERVGMETGLKMEFGEETVRENMENLFNMYPDKPIGVGDNWQNKIVTSHGFPMIATNIYTLQERENGVSTVDMFSMIQPNREGGAMQMGEMKIHYNISGSVAGTMKIDEPTGWIINSNQNLRLTGSTTVEHPQMPQPMTMPISIRGTIVQEPY